MPRRRRASPPNVTDRRRFLEAAREFLILDRDFMRGVKGEVRRDLLRKPIGDVPHGKRVEAEIQRALDRTISDIRRPLESHQREIVAAAGLRILMAYVIAKALKFGATDRNVLLEGALFLREAGREAETLAQRNWGARGDSKINPPSPMEQRMRAEAAAWRQKNPHGTKTAGERTLFKRAPKPHKWKDAQSLHVWLNRKGISV
jgi:hypothetical protein